MTFMGRGDSRGNPARQLTRFLFPLVNFFLTKILTKKIFSIFSLSESKKEVRTYYMIPSRILWAQRYKVIVTPCSISIVIRQSPYTKGHLTRPHKPPRFKGQHKCVNYNDQRKYLVYGLDFLDLSHPQTERKLDENELEKNDRIFPA